MTDNPPIPDPTILTTEQLLRETSGVERLIDAKITGLRGVFDEKFESVDTQFQLVERQRVEQKKDTKDAVDAALAAAKEAVKEQTTASDRSITKSETATKEQINQMQTTFTTANRSTDEKVDDLKTRVERLESYGQGHQQALGLSANVIAAVMSGVFAVVALGLIIYFTRVH